MKSLMGVVEPFDHLSQLAYDHYGDVYRFVYVMLPNTEFGDFSIGDTGAYNYFETSDDMRWETRFENPDNPSRPHFLAALQSIADNNNVTIEFHYQSFASIPHDLSIRWLLIRIRVTWEVRNPKRLSVALCRKLKKAFDSSAKAFIESECSAERSDLKRGFDY